MTVKTAAEIVADAETQLPNNTTRFITPERVRQRIIDLAESIPTIGRPGMALVSAFAGLTVNEQVAAALASIPAGGVLLFPPGDYLFEGAPVELTSNLTVLGVGAVLKANSNNRIFDVSGQENVYFAPGLTFDGLRSDVDVDKRANLVFVEDSDRICFDGVWFVNASSSCIVCGSGVTRSWVRDCNGIDFNECFVDFVGTGVLGFQIKGGLAKSAVVHPNPAVSRPIGVGMEPQVSGVNGDILIDGLVVDFTGLSSANRTVTHGFAVNQHSVPAASFVLKGYRLANCTVRGAGTGARLQAVRYGDVDLAADVAICLCTFEAIRTHAIEVHGGEDDEQGDVVDITGNKINGYSEATEDLYDGIFLAGNMLQPKVQSNRIGRRIAESGSASGRFGINISDPDIVEADVRLDVVGVTMSGPLNDDGTDTRQDLIP